MTENPFELEVSVSVPVGADVAFERFVDDLFLWWPREYTWSQERLDWIGIDPHEGGRCTERSNKDFTLDFGRVLAVQRPDSISMAWCIDPARVPIPGAEKASVVAIDFVSSGAGSTKVSLRHSEFDRHGEKGGEYRDNMASLTGWPYILGKYAASFSG